LIISFDDFVLISKFTVHVAFAVILVVLQMKPGLNFVLKFEFHSFAFVELNSDYVGFIIGGFDWISQHQIFAFNFPIEKCIDFKFWLFGL